MRTRRGFTLVELLLAASLGAMLLAAVATTAMGLSQQVAQLQSESSDVYDKVLARITRDVRYSWWVDLPASNRLRIADEDGLITEYYQVGNSLLVRLPSGEEGSVVTGLDAVSFAPENTQRLREAATSVQSGDLDQFTTVDAQSDLLILRPAEELALGFFVASGTGAGSVDGVEEQVLDYLVTGFKIPVAAATTSGTIHYELYAARAPEDARPRPGQAAIATGSLSVGGLPPLMTANWTKGWADYDDDVEDACAAIKSSVVASKSAVLGILDPRSGLLVGGVGFTALQKAIVGDAADAAVDACNAAIALADGDDDDDLLATQYAATAAFEANVVKATKNVKSLAASPVDNPVSIAVGVATGTPLSAPLRPGTAYTLVLKLSGTNARAVMGLPATVTPTSWNVARRDSSGSAWEAQPYRVVFSITGDATTTTTTPSTVVERVKASLTPTNTGVARSASATVYGQALAEDAWLGVVPGESPSGP